MNILQEIRKNAKSNKKTIALPEGCEPRTLKAVEIIKKEGFANVILIGKEDKIKEKAKSLNVNIDGIKIIDPLNYEKTEEYAETFCELRKKKGMTIEKAREIVKDEVYFGTMMVKTGDVDGMVSGAVHSTGDLLRPGLQIVKTAPGTKIVSSFFINIIPNCKYADNGLVITADCAVNPNPAAEELASIAISTAKSAKALCKMEPRVAMLSFSTKGSAKNELVDKVVEATRIAKEMAPDLALDGELQLDAAVVPEVADLKAPGSSVAGKANVLIFPDLNSGNIGYKLIQRFGNAQSIGPITQGFAMPINDLSRGCNVEDIVNIVAITAVQAQGIK